MNKGYTAHNNSAVDQFVDEQLQQVTQAVVSLMGDSLEAILLGGGFGRGEGSVAIAKDGAMHVVNDYDLEIVYREPWGKSLSKLITHLRFRKRLDTLAEELAQILKIKQIDLSPRGVGSYVLSTAPRLSDYDLKYGHHLLYGKNNPTDVMPWFRSQDIPAFEGTWLLRNRGLGMLLSFLYFMDKKGTLPEPKKENFYTEINKAILAMGDALYLLRGEYTCSYAERAANFTRYNDCNFPRMNELMKLYSLAVGYKLLPQQDMFTNITPLNLWHQVNTLYVEFFLFYESERLGMCFTGLDQYAEWVFAQPTIGLKQRLHLQFDKLTGRSAGCLHDFLQLKQDKPRSLLFVISMLASREPSGICEEAFHIVRSLAGKNNDSDSNTQRWKNWAYSFLLLIHPTGEVGRFLSSIKNVSK
ncbi:MAG: hypothetical protein OEZ01_00055 [Candidatus Heimdallarchaeota archaeon]|nr:hypothetical protein [Candidatus Heimdallarchaeota archaeon]